MLRSTSTKQNSTRGDRIVQDAVYTNMRRNLMNRSILSSFFKKFSNVTSILSVGVTADGKRRVGVHPSPLVNREHPQAAGYYNPHPTVCLQRIGAALTEEAIVYR